MSLLPKTISLLSFLTLLSFIFISPVQAQTANITTIRGQILDDEGQPFKFAKVQVNCDGKTQNSITSGQGKYIAIFAGNNCGIGDPVTVTATKDGKSGSSTGIVQNRRDGRIVDVNFSVVSFNINVPEFGLLPGAIAALGSAGAFLAIRRRKI